MSHPPEREFSTKLSQALDILGLSLQDVRLFQLVAGFLQQANKGTHLGHIQNYIVGSKGEGISFSEPTSDLDIMRVEYSSCCSTSPCIGSHYRYRICLEHCPSGYGMLQILRESDHDPIKNVWIDDNVYLPSDSSYLEKNNNTTMHVSGPTVIYKIAQINSPHYLLHQTKRTGPSIELSHEDVLSEARQSADCVRAYPADVKTYFRIWCHRKRPYGFPSRKQIEEISKMDAHVVPVGCKYTENPGLQWRICFTFGEIALIHSFNGTQYKVYALLKMLSKSVLKPVCPAITSYVMKNVLLWISELYHPSLFQETNIPQCLIICLQFLRKCVRGRYVPNYMIPTRDLLYGKLKEKTVRELDKLLSELISERGQMVLRCEHVRFGLHMVIKLPLMGKLKIPRNFETVLTDLATEQMQEKLHSDNLLSELEGNIHQIERCFPSASADKKVALIIREKGCKRRLIQLQSDPRHGTQIAKIWDLFSRCEQMEQALLESLLSDDEQLVTRLFTEKLVKVTACFGQEFLQYALPVFHNGIHNLWHDQSFRETTKNVVSHGIEKLTFGSEEEKHQVINTFATWFRYGFYMMVNKLCQNESSKEIIKKT